MVYFNTVVNGGMSTVIPVTELVFSCLRDFFEAFNDALLCFFFFRTSSLHLIKDTDSMCISISYSFKVKHCYTMHLTLNSYMYT